MDKKVMRPISKIVVVLTLVACFTLLFTIYQTSVNKFVVDTLDKLDIDTAPLESVIVPDEVAFAGEVHHSNPVNYSGANAISAPGEYNLEQNDYIGSYGTGSWLSRINTTFTYEPQLTENLTRAFSQRVCSYYGECYVYWASRGARQAMACYDNVNDKIVDTSGECYKTDTVYHPCSNADSKWLKNKPRLDTDGTNYTSNYSGITKIIMQIWTESCNYGGEQTARVNQISITITTTDATAPTISIEGGSTSGQYTTSTTIKITDTGAGVNTATYKYTPFNNNNSSYCTSPFAATGQTATTETTLPLNKGEGTYEITATDNVGNTSTKTIKLYNPTLQVSQPNLSISDNGTDIDVGKATISNGSGLTKGQEYYLYMDLNVKRDGSELGSDLTNRLGKYFTGWKLVGGTATLGIGTYEDGKWKVKATVGDPAPANNGKTTFTWEPQFAPIGTGCTADKTYKAAKITCETNIDSTYYYTLDYSGTADGGGSYSYKFESTNPTNHPGPIYAGLYTVITTVYDVKGGNIVGTHTFSYTISKRNIDISTTEFTRSMEYNSTDGTGTLSPISGSDWTYTSQGSDVLSFGNCAIKSNGKDVGEWGVTRSGSEAITVSNASENGADVAASYKVNNVTINSGATVTITKHEISFSVTILPKALKDAYYLDAQKNLKKLTADTLGRPYNGTRDAGAIVRVSFPDGTIYSRDNGYVSIAYNDASFDNARVGIRNLNITGIHLCAPAGSDSESYKNYKLRSAEAGETGDESDLTQSYTATAYITIIDVTLGITSQAVNHSKVYDGTNVADTNAITVEINNKSTVIMPSDQGITVGKGTATYADANVGTGKTITLSGYSLAGITNADCYRISGTMPTTTGDITQKSLVGVTTIAAVADITYNGQNHTATPAVTISGLAITGGTATLVNNTDFTYSYSSDTKNVGTVTVTVTAKESGNYTGSVSSTYKIVRRKVYVTANSLTAIYGVYDNISAVGELTYSVTAATGTTGLVGDETLTGGLTYSDNAGYTYAAKSPDVGTYNIIQNSSLNNANNSNYDINFTAGTLEITPKTISVIANNASFTYGESYPDTSTLTFIIKVDDVETANQALLSPLTGGLDYAHTIYTDVGNYDGMIVMDSNLSTKNTNYNIVFTAGKLTISRKTLYVKANSKSVTYGDAIPSIDTIGFESVSGKVGNYDLVGGLKYAVAVDTIKNAGTYYIVANDTLNDPTQNPNYTIEFTQGTLTVNPKSITVTAGTLEVNYGDDYFSKSLTFTTSGLVGNDRLNGGLTFNFTAAEKKINAATYQNVIVRDATMSAAASNPNYTITTFTAGALIINKKVVTVTASSPTVFYGEALPALSFIVRDASNNVINDGSTVTPGSDTSIQDTFNANIIRTATAYSTDETSDIKVGSYYTYIASLNAVNANNLNVDKNYTVSYARGTFTIDRRPVKVTPNENQFKYYGDIDSSTGLSYTVVKNDNSLTGDALYAGTSLTGKLARQTGESVDLYKILQGTILNDSNPNYDITFVENVKFEIKKKEITVVPDVIVIYVEDDIPEVSSITYTVRGGLVGNDRLKGGFTFTEYVEGMRDETVLTLAPGSYDIIPDATFLYDPEDSDDVDYNPNYLINFDGKDRLIVRALTAFISANNNVITFGDATPTLVYSANDHNNVPIPLGRFTGALSLLNAPNGLLPAGSYEISVGTLDSTYYTIQLVTDAEGNAPKLTVNKKNVTVSLATADSDGVYQGHIYGTIGENRINTLPVSNSQIIGYVSGCGLAEGSTLTVNYGGLSKEAAGKYPLTIGNLASKNPNYNFAFDRTYYYEIAPRPIVIVPESGLSSVYGDAEEDIGYTTYYKNDSSLDGLLTDRDAYFNGKLVRSNPSVKNVGEYAITLGTLNSSSIAGYNPNYELYLSTTPVVYEITRRSITVTANAQTQIFGESERVLTVKYSFGGFGNGDVSLNGKATRDAGETPASYTINQGTITNENNPNYNIRFISAQYTISVRPVTLYAKNASKSYGKTDPTPFEFVVSGGTGTTSTNTNENGFVTLGGIDYTPIIIIDRESGEIPKSYNYTYSVEGEYASYYRFTYRTDTQFTITPAQAKIDIPGATKVNDALYTYTCTYNGNDYSLTPVLTVGEGLNIVVRINGKVGNTFSSAGSYTATVSVASNAYYNGISSLTVNITVNPYDLGELDPATILGAQSITKVYGELDPDFEAIVNGVNGEEVAVTFSRTAGSDADSYLFDSITLGSTDYIADIASDAYFTITKRAIEVTPSAFTKVYGTSDLALVETVNGINDDSFEVVFEREIGENSGKYSLTSVDIADHSSKHYQNYSVSFAADSEIDKFTITPKVATITATPVARVFDGTDGSITTEYTSSGIREADKSSIAGSLKVVTAAGQDVIGLPVAAGSYYIVEDVAFANPNYTIEFTKASYTISRAEITITTDDATYEYGQTIAPFVPKLVSGTIFAGYELVGSLGTLESTDVGAHDIPQGTLDNEHNPNYNITYITGTCTITIIHLIIKPVALTEQVYGDPASVIRYDIIGSPIATDLVDGMLREGALAASGNNTGYHNVTIGTLQSANNNYEITFQADGAQYRIVPRPITVTAANIYAEYGDPRVTLQYVVNDGGLVGNDVLNGELFCPYSPEVNTYSIDRGTITNANNPNYTITFISAQYVIAPRSVKIKILDQSSEYVPTGLYNVSQSSYTIVSGNIIEGDDLSIVITKEEGIEMGFYTLSGSYNNRNYAVEFINGKYEVRKYASTIIADKNIVIIYNGRPLYINAVCSSGAPVELSYEVNGDIYHENRFVEVGKYVVTLSAEETDHYYAPENEVVEIIIMRDTLSAESGGIDIRVDNEDGFAPESSVSMEKLPQNDPGLNSVISSSETIVRAYNMKIIHNDGVIDSYKNSPSISIKVPSALKDQETVKVVVKDGSDYSVRILTVDHGYVTITNAANIQTIAFIQDQSNKNYLLFVLIGCAALIVVVSIAVFMFKKRV